MSDETGENGFQDYNPTTMDPGNSMLIATLLFCVILIGFLPCLFGMAKRFQHESETETDSSENETTKNSKNLAEKLNQRPQQSKLSSKERKRLKNSTTGSQDGGANSAVAPYHTKKSGEDEGDEDAASSSSSSSAASTHSVRSAASAVMKALLMASPHANPVRTQITALRVDREEEEETRSVLSSVGDGGMMGGGDAKSVDSNSVLGKLSQDEVSIRDAVDTPASAVVQDALEFVDDKPGADQSCCSRMRSLFDKLLIIVEWNYESRRICKLGFPFVSQAIVEGVAEAVRVAIVGKLISTQALSAYVVIDLMVGLSVELLSGFQDALATLCSHAVGGGKKKLAGQYVQIATICYSLCFIPIFVIWSFYAGDVVRWFGFDEETVKIGEDFALLFLFSEFLDGLNDSVHGLLDTIGLEVYSTVFICTQEILSVLAMLMVGLYSGTSTLQLVGVVMIGEDALALVVNIALIVWNGWFDRYLEGLVGGFALLVRA